MFGSQVLDVLIGMVFVYLLLSIICTAANEMIAGMIALRATNLAKGISNLLADGEIKNLGERFYDHPLIKSLYRGKRKPSYIPAHTFALAFLDGIVPFGLGGENAIVKIRESVSGLKGESELKRLLSIFLQQAGDDFAKLQAIVETWFNDSMARVGGWYKRKSQVITISLALVLTGATNADTLLIVKKLSTDPALRAIVVAQAQEYARQQSGTVTSKSDTTHESSSLETTGAQIAAAPVTTTPAAGRSKEIFAQSLETLQNLGVPLGWEQRPKNDEWVNKIIGLLLTALAISLGAPFWFDVLSRITKIRSTGATTEPTVKEGKKEKPA